MRDYESMKPECILFNDVQTTVIKLMPESNNEDRDVIRKKIKYVPNGTTPLDEVAEFISSNLKGYTSENIIQNVKDTLHFEPCTFPRCLKSNIFSNGTVEEICEKLFKSARKVELREDFDYKSSDIAGEVSRFVLYEGIGKGRLFMADAKWGRELYFWDSGKIYPLCTVYYDGNHNFLKETALWGRGRDLIVMDLLYDVH